MPRPARCLFVLLACVQCALLCACGTPGGGRDDAEIAAMRINYVLEDGVQISAIQNGDVFAQRVIYVHGTPGAATAFTRYLKNPVEGLYAVSIDRPGFGKTKPMRAEPSLARQAEAIEPLLRPAADGSLPVLVGHSLGGPIIAQAAAMYPDRVGAIVIVSGSLDPSLERVLFIQRFGNFAFVPWLIPRWLRNTNRELIPLKQELTSLGEVLDDVVCPVVIIHGTRDRLVPYSNVSYMVGALSSASSVDVVTLDGEDHFIVWTAEDEIRESVAHAAELARKWSSRPVPGN